MARQDLILDAQGIHAWYGSSHVLHGIDLTIARGETVGLLGRNGMGKTTLIRTLMGYVPAASGRATWAGHGTRAVDVTGWAPERMARLGIGYVPEGRGIFPNLSVLENLAISERAGVDGKRNWTRERVPQTSHTCASG